MRKYVLSSKYNKYAFHKKKSVLPGETPPYYYGTHYFSAMIVASYLVIMEPFT